MKNSEIWSIYGEKYANLLDVKVDTSCLNASIVRELCLFHKLRERIDLFSGYILDAGCGSCDLIKRYLDKKNLKIFGADISWPLLERASKTNFVSQISLTRCNMEQGFPFSSNIFNFTLINLVIQWIQNIEFFLSEVYRICSPKSKTIITIQHPYFGGKISRWDCKNPKNPNLTIESDTFQNRAIHTSIGNSLHSEFDINLTYFSRTPSYYFETFRTSGFDVLHFEELYCQDEILNYDPQWIRHVKVPAFILFELGKK